MKDYILLIYKVFWDVLVRWRKIREPNGKEDKLKMGKGNDKKIMADGVKPLAYNLGGQDMKRIVSFLVLVALFTSGIGLFSDNGDVIVKTKDELGGKITGAKVIVCVGKDGENQLNVGCSSNQRLIQVDTDDPDTDPDADVNFQEGDGDIPVDGFSGKCYQKTAGDNEDTVTFTNTNDEIGGVENADKFAVLIGKDGYITQCGEFPSYNPNGENKVNDSDLQVPNKFTVKITTLEIGYKQGSTVKGINKTVGIDKADNYTKAISGFVDANGNRDLNGTSNTIFKFGEQTLIPTTDNNDPNNLQSPNRARLKTENNSEAWFIPIVPNISCNPTDPPSEDKTTTFDIQISGYLKRTVTINCKDGQTSNFSPYGEQIIVKLADSGAGAGDISCTVNQNTACADPLETTAKISSIQRARDNRTIGIGTADATTSAVADATTLGDNARGGNFEGVNGLSFVATVGTTKYIFLAVEDKPPAAGTCSSSASTVRAFEFLLKGYFYPKDSNIHTNNTTPTLCFDKATITKFGTDQVDIKFSDIADDCTAGEAQICGKALDFSVKIDRIEDEFCQEIGIGSPSGTGAVSTGSTDSNYMGLGKFGDKNINGVDTGDKAGNTAFSSTELNGRPYIDTTNKIWYVPVPANAAGSGDFNFSIFINGYAKKTVSFNSNDFENFQNVTKTLQFGPESPNTNDVCQAAFYKCAERINFAFKIKEVKAEAPVDKNLLAKANNNDQNNPGYVISKDKTFIKVSLVSGQTEVPASYNGENKGTLITEEKSCTNNHNVPAGVWGFAIKDMLNQNTNDLTVDLVPDGFLQSSNTDDGSDTDSNKNFLKLNAGYFQNRSNQVEVSFSGLEWAAKLTVIKTETGTGLNFKNLTSFNDCNENTERPCVAKDTVFDFGTSTNVVKYIYETANTIYLALPGTKSLVEGGTASATSLSVSVPGFIRQSVNVTLKKDSQLTVEFDGDPTGDSETKFSGGKLQFKAKVTKIIARAGASSFADVTTSVGVGKFAIVSNFVNGAPILSGGVYYIPFSSDIRKFRIKSVTLVVNGVVTVYDKLDVDVSSAFNTPNQVTIEIAKSGGTGTEFCSSTATICSNTILDFASPKVESVEYNNTKSMRITIREGIGSCTFNNNTFPLSPEIDIVRAGENFEIRFTYKDENGFAPQEVKIKFDLNENGEFENETAGDIVKTFTGASIVEVDPLDTNIKDGKVYKVTTSLPFRKNTKLSDTNGGRGNIDRIFLGNISTYVDRVGNNGQPDGICDDNDGNQSPDTIKFIDGRLTPAITATASSGLESDEVSATKPLVVRDNDPTLTGATVTPSSGNPGQQFTFEVTYTDADNNPPKLLYLWIDLNGDGKEDPATEYFSVTKKDINDNDYTNGAVYQAKVTLNEARSYTARFFASDGFICGTSGYTLSDVNNFTSTQKIYLCNTNSPDTAGAFPDNDGDGFNDNDIDKDGDDDSTNGTNIVNSGNINFTVNLPAGFTPEDAPSIDFVGVSGFTNSEGGVTNSCRGAVEPDGGTNFQSGSKVVIAVKYTSPKNRAPQTIKAYLDYGPNADGVSDPAEIVSLKKATPADVDSWANVSSSVKTAVKAVAALFDGSYTNGELYYAEVQAFGPTFRILRVVANDGVQIGSKAFVIPTREETRLTPPIIVKDTCVTLVSTDLDGDGIDDNLEDMETVGNPQKVTLALNNYDSGKNLKVKVAVEALSGGSSAPTFADGTRAVTLENAAGFGTLSFPDENLSVYGAWILNVKGLNQNIAETVRFTITLPSPLPIGAKIFKTDASNAWFDITSSVSISSDRKTITFTATDGSPFDTNPEPGAIGDPIGIFIPGGGGEGQIFGGGAGGGGGCFVNPKFDRGTGSFDGGIFVLITTLGLYALYRLFAKAKKANI